MSDPIAAAEAAGKARDIANRFETAVFLIAYGIAEKDGLYEADPHRYPYSQAFRHGMNILAALCAECSDDAEELLPTFNESDFIRNSAASDVREWTARWRDECREAVEGCRSIEIGPLASVDGDYFAATSECYEVLRFAENDLLGGHQERRVYEFLRAGTQEQYVYGRRMLIRHPLLTWNEYVRIKTGLALGDPDPLDQGEADTIDPVWLQEFVSMAYEPVPGAAKVCPNCGWTMTMRGKQPHCSSATCAKAVTGDFDKLDSVAHDAFRLSRGVMHYISSPGKLELAIAEAAAGLGLKYEMWPLKDTCDILIHLPDGRQLAVDAKAYGRAERLAREIEDDAGIAQMCADEVAYVVFTSLIFSVRPMGTPHDLGGRYRKLNGLIEREVGDYPANPGEFATEVRASAWRTWKTMERDENLPMGAWRTMGRQFLVDDAISTLMVTIIQIFGRLARLADKERPAPHVYFADAAFRGGDGKLSFRTLEELGAYMERLMHDSDQPEVAKALYGPFYESFRKGIGNVGL